MKNIVSEKAESYGRERRRKRGWNRIVTFMAAIVVFCTTYALILPAITMEKYTCGLEEHHHTASCYSQGPAMMVRVLDCPYEKGLASDSDADGKEHVHTEECYRIEKIPMASVSNADRYSDYRWLQTASGSNAYRWDEEEEDWVEIAVASGSDWDSSTATWSNWIFPTATWSDWDEEPILCDLTEEDGHVHTEECFEGWVLICDKPEHTHTDACRGLTPLTPEEQAQVDEVIALIDALSTQEQIGEKLAAFEDAGDEDGYDAYLTEAIVQTKAAYEAYSALTEIQQEHVTNVDKLMALEPLWSVQTMEETAEIGYVSSIVVTTTDGTAPFDDGEENGKGLDNGPSNGYVRTFDTLKYDLDLTFKSLSDKSYTVADLGFEFTLPKSLTEAAFDLSAMSWALGDSADYQIQYLGEGDKVILYLDKDGKLYRTNNTAPDPDTGFYSGGTPTTVNTLANGSGETSGDACYQYLEVESQRMIGTYTADLVGSPIIEGTLEEWPIGVKVLNDSDRDVIEPTFTVWLTANKENMGYNDQTDGSAEDKELVKIDKNTVTPTPVKISAGPLYNMEIDYNGYMAYKSWFDFTKGNEVSAVSTYEIDGKTITGAQMYALLEKLGTLSENIGVSEPEKFTANDSDFNGELLNGLQLSAYEETFKNIRYGRMYGYGIDIQLANTDKNGSKGMKGLSLPYGDITFDMILPVEATSKNPETDCSAYYAILWDYRENVNCQSSRTYSYEEGKTLQAVRNDTKNMGNWERNFYWDKVDRTVYAAEIIPYAYGGKTQDEQQAYHSGTWLNTDAETTGETAPDMVYHFKVSGYDFDLNDYTFPIKHANSGQKAARFNYEYVFSAGYVQTLAVIPRQAAGTVDVKINPTVGNLRIKSTSGYELMPEESGSSIAYNHETNTAGIDNNKSTAVTFYAPGTATKENSFVYRKATNVGSADMFLGSNYWGGFSHDASAYAGSDIAIMGRSYISAQSDYHTRALNLLQLFDSTALQIDEDLTKDTGDKDRITAIFGSDIMTPEKISTTGVGIKFLYVADSAYPGGYDTNATGNYNRSEDNKLVAGMMGDDGLMRKDCRMNTVREEDLKYYEDLSELEEDGYTCVGVLMEVRNCDIRNGVSTYLRIPVKVNDSEPLVGKTVATVNTVQIWVQEHAMTTDEGTLISRLTGNIGAEKWSLSKPNTEGTGTGWDINNGNGENGYQKTEYKNGVYKGHTGGHLYGNSLLILGYKAGIAIDETAKKGSYSLNGGSTDADFTLKTIRTYIDDGLYAGDSQTTTLHISLSVTAKDENGNTIENPDIALTANQYKINGETISMDSNNPTLVDFTANGETYSYSIYAEQSVADSKTVQFTLTNVPVGITLPDISFVTNLGKELSNNDQVTAIAAISGTGDQRAYTEVNGNRAAATVTVYKQSSTGLSKAVDTTMIELDGDIKYTVRYSNGSEDALNTLYLYDILPYNKDDRGSKYNNDETATDETILETIEFFSKQLGSDENTDVFQGNVKVYYSTMVPDALYNLLTGFNGAPGSTDGEQNADAIEEMLKNQEYFRLWGTVTNGEFVANGEHVSKESITGVFVKVESLGGQRTIVMELHMKTNHNLAGDFYGNVAWAWIPNSNTEPLRSDLVQTVAIGREISGVVWADANLNGVRDLHESLISGVTATLFVKQSDGSYAQCIVDVTGKDINPVITGGDGSYKFEKLAAGEYIVAFSGETLEDYAGATHYQVKKRNDDDTNDGVALSKREGNLLETVAKGLSLVGDYRYVIAYSLKKEDSTVKDMSMHSIAEIKAGNGSLKDYLESYMHQDLGLIKGTTHELPQTGGSGTMWYIMVGWLLMGSAVILLVYKSNFSESRISYKNGTEDSGSYKRGKEGHRCGRGANS